MGLSTVASPQANTTRKSRSVEAAVCGMRRLDCVRMVEGAQPRFFLVGVGHRFPVEREVTPAVARVLLEELPCRYERRERVSWPVWVCHCRAVTDSRVRDAIAQGAADETDIGRACGAGTGCGSCHDELRRLCEEGRAALLARDAQSLVGAGI